MFRGALYKQLISGRTDFRFENPLVFERDQATSLKSTVIIIIVIIIIIIIIIININIIRSVQFIRPYFFSKGLVQTLNLGHLRVSLSLLSLDG